MRLFTALALPDEIAPPLLLMQAGVPGARWQKREQLHLTLRFIGEVDGAQATAIDDALATIAVPSFTLELKGVGSFGGKIPRDLWAGAAPSEPLVHLNRKIESALQRIGLEPEARKFTPHVTLARLKNSPRGAVMDYLTDHALYASTPFTVTAFCLYSSKLTSDGSIYRVEKEYGLTS
ncbi:RNA 2',3'-cyclic phosphodiesterase [Rhizomicrobium electricum]|uniref:RNA 2',3'-cyclic phosphodiesterase n=1 Tax=Rhizomicrobium electricum TaxID=480070 RepID=A0ABN1E4I5_9PROT|nr:RNA 2',3'-cyclic phosphodiesterase [Rhizomicrobium electricum]NIJ47631.1 2'-5' RNA ligase [Rhizomicrobium electricum]